MRRLVLAVLVLLLSATSVHAADWERREIRLGVNLAELVLPIFGESGSVNRRAAIFAGLSWSQVDPEEIGDPTADGLKPFGFFVGGSIDVDDEPFNWVEIGGGFSYEQAFQVGLVGWVGNATTKSIDAMGNEVVSVAPGLDFKTKMLFGLGLDATP